jgi:hypothetical protein
MRSERSIWFGGVMALAVVAVTLLVGATTVLAKRAFADEKPLVVAPLVVAQATTDYHLFKVLSAKDEIIIGLSQAEAEALGRGEVLDNLARRLADHGQITVWQFSPRHSTSGKLELAALRRVAIMKTDAIRIEPYKAALPVVGPST